MSVVGMTLSYRDLAEVGPANIGSGASTLLGYAETAMERRAAQPRQNPAAVDRDATTIEAADLATTAEWLPSALANLARLRNLTARWHSCGAAPPNDDALMTSARVLQRLAEADLHPASIAPSTDEGVCVSFENGKKYADIECFNSGDVLAVISDGTKKPEIWEVSRASLPETIARISDFIAG